jgi:hypothetical protein
MGLNAQTTVPTFTTGQVLTATQMNESARTGVPVFADTTARDAGFGGSGEKVLAEGQLCYLESTNVVQYYDGAAWATVGPTSGSPLVYITQGTFSAVASVSMPAGTFTSTYKHYKVLLNITSTSTGQGLGVRVNAAGSALTTSNYNGGFVAVNNGGTVTGLGASNASSAVGTHIHSTRFAELDLTVYNPTASGTYTSWSGTTRGAAADGNTAGTAGGQFYDVVGAHDGLTFVVGGTFGGTYYVYGIKDS